MKNLITLINLSIIFGITAIFTASNTNQEKAGGTVKATASEPICKSVSQQMKITKTQATKELTPLQKSVEEFLAESTEARLMDLEEGKIAEQRSTTSSLKNYGKLMVKEQSEMLADLKKLAEKKAITLPLTLGENKSGGLADLKKEHGQSFDKKFIKMMILDHKRDVKKFEKATKSKDAEVQVFDKISACCPITFRKNKIVKEKQLKRKATI